MRSDALTFLERISNNHGWGLLLVGGILLSAWLGGHGALYGAYRVASSPTVTTAVAEPA